MRKNAANLSVRARTAVGALVAAGTLAGMVAASGPATAAPSCTGNSTITRSGLSFTLPSVGNNTGNLNCMLGVGNQSVAVRNLQANLNNCYWTGSNASGSRDVFSPALAVDGIYGTRTKAALAAVQRHHGIDDDGIYGPQTRRTILFLADNGGAGVCRVFGA
jgi:hypothetical protein